MSSSPLSGDSNWSPTTSVHPPASWQESLNHYAPYIAGASLLLSVVARRYASQTLHLAEEIANAERIRPASLHGSNASVYGKVCWHILGLPDERPFGMLTQIRLPLSSACLQFEGRLFAAKPEHVVFPERAPTIEALQVCYSPSSLIFPPRLFVAHSATQFPHQLSSIADRFRSTPRRSRSETSIVERAAQTRMERRRLAW